MVRVDEIHCTVRDILATDSSFVESLATNTAKRIFESSLSAPAPESLGSLETHDINGLSFMHSERTEEA